MSGEQIPIEDMPARLEHIFMVCHGLTVIAEEIRPLYSMHGVARDLTESMYLFGYIKFSCDAVKSHVLVQGHADLTFVSRQPQQRNSALKSIEHGILGAKPKPAAPHFLDAWAHAVSYLIEKDNVARSQFQSCLEAWDDHK